MIIARNAHVASEGNTTLHTADHGGTLQIRVLNTGAASTEIELYLTATPAQPAAGDRIDMATLDPGQALLLSGEPVATGESVVVKPSGNNINLSCRVSGFVED